MIPTDEQLKRMECKAGIHYGLENANVLATHLKKTILACRILKKALELADKGWAELNMVSPEPEDWISQAIDELGCRNG